MPGIKASGDALRNSNKKKNLSPSQVNKTLNTVSSYNAVTPMDFDNDLPGSIKDFHFLDKEICSFFKPALGSFSSSLQFSKAEEKVIPIFFFFSKSLFPE